METGPTVLETNRRRGAAFKILEKRRIAAETARKYR
jgi:hypothetical protein